MEISLPTSVSSLEFRAKYTHKFYDLQAKYDYDGDWSNMENLFIVDNAEVGTSTIDREGHDKIYNFTLNHEHLLSYKNCHNIRRH